MRPSFPTALALSLCAGLLLSTVVPLVRGELRGAGPVTPVDARAPAGMSDAVDGAATTADADARGPVAAPASRSLLRAISGPVAALMGLLIGLGLCLMRRDLANR